MPFCSSHWHDVIGHCCQSLDYDDSLKDVLIFILMWNGAVSTPDIDTAAQDAPL